MSKKLEKQLKNQSKALLPDESLKQKIKADLFGENTRQAAEKPYKKPFFTPSRITAMVTAFVLILSAAVVAMVYKTRKDKPTDGDFGLDGYQDVYAFAAFSAGNILAGFGGGASAAAEVSEGELSFITDYMAMVDSLLVKAPTITEATSDRPQYAVRLMVSFKDSFGDDIVYNIYYNESILIDEEDDDDEGEVESSITGVMVCGEVEYPIFGEKEIEVGEYEISLTVKLDNNNYVVVEQGVEEAENEFSYQIYKNGRLEESFEVEVEQLKSGRSAVEVVVVKAGVETHYDYTIEKGEDILVSVYDLGSTEKSQIKVRSKTVDGKKVYAYSYDNKMVEHKKPF